MSESRPSSRRTIGEEPKPRVLFSWEGPAAEQVAAVLDLHAPTVRVIDDLLEIRQDDYDVLVTNRLSNMLVTRRARFKGVEPHLFVVSVAPPDEKGSTAGAADQCGQSLNFYGIRWETGYRSRAVDLPAELPSAATDLINDDLVPAALSRDSHIYFAATTTERPQPGSDEDRRRFSGEMFDDPVHELLHHVHPCAGVRQPHGGDSG